MINKPTCYKNLEKPSCIDLILTNCPSSFQNSSVMETRLSDFHKMVTTVMKTTFRKMEPKAIQLQFFLQWYFQGVSTKYRFIELER